MKTSVKSVYAMKVTLLIRTLFACLVIAALCFAAISTQAGGAEDKAKKAFADWKAAQGAVAAAKEKLADAQKALQNAMTAVAKSGGKPTAAQEAALAQGREAVARAEAALREAEKQELAARVALESAIAELPDGPLKDQLKRERNFPSLVTANGLYTVKFDTPSGQLTVHLPDDMRAGDTITGTVSPEPKGSTEEERTRNRGVLNGYVVQIEGQKFPVDKGSLGPMVVRRLTGPHGPGVPPTDNSFFDIFVAIDALNDSAAARARIPLLPSATVITHDQITTPSFIIPSLGQTGRPIVITGPFDGNSSNTKLSFQPTQTEALPIMRPLPSLADFSIVAESPRKAVFESPENVTGPIQITVKEGDKQTTGTYRNVGVNLTAPKTKLLKGESTTLRIEVSGLHGITEPVPLHLVKGGVVTMQGGDVQSIMIKPAEVQANGTFSMTRGITGVEAGGWNATATVVVFDTCLQGSRYEKRETTRAAVDNVRQAFLPVLDLGYLHNPNNNLKIFHITFQICHLAARFRLSARLVFNEK